MCRSVSSVKRCRNPLNCSSNAIALAPQKVIAVGGVHIAIALTQLAKIMGYRTTVVDRAACSGMVARFPHIDRLIQAWPDGRAGPDHIIVLKRGRGVDA